MIQHVRRVDANLQRLGFRHLECLAHIRIECLATRELQLAVAKITLCSRFGILKNVYCELSGRITRGIQHRVSAWCGRWSDVRKPRQRTTRGEIELTCTRSGIRVGWNDPIRNIIDALRVSEIRKLTRPAVHPPVISNPRRVEFGINPRSDDIRPRIRSVAATRPEHHL